MQFTAYLPLSDLHCGVFAEIISVHSLLETLRFPGPDNGVTTKAVFSVEESLENGRSLFYFHLTSLDSLDLLYPFTLTQYAVDFGLRTTFSSSRACTLYSGKMLVSVKFLSAILGPEMAAPILWVPRISAFFLQEKSPCP